MWIDKCAATAAGVTFLSIANFNGAGTSREHFQLAPDAPAAPIGST